jgi:hypothetical protein
VPTCAAIGQDSLGGIWALGAARGRLFALGTAPALIGRALETRDPAVRRVLSGRARLEADDGATYDPPEVKDLKSGRLAPTMLTFDVPPRTRPVLLIFRLNLGNIDTYHRR